MPPKPKPVYPRHYPLDPLLRELVLIHVYGSDGENFDTLLTRVPGIGEVISREDRSYRVTRVAHEPVNEDGKARLGWHAFVDAVLMNKED